MTPGSETISIVVASCHRLFMWTHADKDAHVVILRLDYGYCEEVNAHGSVWLDWGCRVLQHAPRNNVNKLMKSRYTMFIMFTMVNSWQTLFSTFLDKVTVEMSNTQIKLSNKKGFEDTKDVACLIWIDKDKINSLGLKQRRPGHPPVLIRE